MRSTEMGQLKPLQGTGGFLIHKEQAAGLFDQL